MKPIGLTLKRKGFDKYTGQEKYGDVMIIHQCAACNKINFDRIAADDSVDTLMKILKQSGALPKKTKNELSRQGIKLLTQADRKLIIEGMFGKQH